MKLRVEQLAARSGLSVDTIRYYQTRGLLAPPRREGRVAWYDEGHLERLRRVRRLAADGFSLEQIQRLLAQAAPDGALLEALAEEQVGSGRTFTRAELADETGLPEALLAGAERAGLMRPLDVDGESRFTEADLAMARAGLELVNGGFPLGALLDLARDHAGHVREVTERAIDLFDDHVRKRPDGSPNDPAQVVETFRVLLPQVTRLVAAHFQQTLVSGALARLSDSVTEQELREALTQETGSGLEVQVAWR